MTFKIKANPTFEATLTLVGQGREQKLKLTFRHMTRSAYGELLKAVGEGDKSVEDAVLAAVEAWDADTALAAEAVRDLDEQQPGATWAILSAYGDALGVARKGN